MFIMGNMALLWGGCGIFSDVLILFGFPGLQTHYKGRNMQRILVKYVSKPNLTYTKVFIMGTMAVLGEGYGIFSELLILFRFPGLQAQYLGQNMPMTKGRICI